MLSTPIYIISHFNIFPKIGSFFLLCAHGRVGQTQHFFSWRRISQSEIRNSAAAESEGGQKFLPPNPLPFCPPERLDFRIRSPDFRQKKFGF